MSNEFSGNLSDFRMQSPPPLSLDEINAAIVTLNRFYEYAPHSWGEIEQTANSLDEYRHRIGESL